MITKTFYAYTPQDFKIVHTTDSRKPFEVRSKEIPYGDRATIAVAVDSLNIRYGISICDEEDVFDKKKGRDMATTRMMNNFGSIPMANFKFKKAVTPDQIALYFLNKLTNSVYSNIGKYKKKIHEFSKPKNNKSK